MENYHLCIDSGLMGLEHTVTILETAYLLEKKASS